LIIRKIFKKTTNPIVNYIKGIISNLFEQLGYYIIKKGGLVKITGEKLPFSYNMIPREEYRFAHPLVHGYPDVHLETYKVNPEKDDEIIAERLINSYQKAIKDEEGIINRPQKDLWEILRQVKHNDFVQLLEQRDPVALSEYLCNMSKYSITHGMTQGPDNYKRIAANKSINRWYAALYIDKLVTLGEAIGCLPYENPEFGRWGENLYIKIDDLVAKIEEVIGIDITPPRISGELFGIASRKGIFHFRDINSIYTAWRIRELLKNINNPSVCEIGGGTGRVAYYCYKMGIKNYTIIDLPYVCVISAYYLIKSLPDAKIILYGEKDDEWTDSIKIYPYWCFNEIPDNYFDLTLNQDSFPEIDYEIVIEYLKQIKRNTRNYFLSINQESLSAATGVNNTRLIVSQLLTKLEGEYKRIYRFPYWLREGYLEELYKIIKSTGQE